jgi:RNA polymerase sigma-70 factor (ECF subfamily)
LWDSDSLSKISVHRSKIFLNNSEAAAFFMYEAGRVAVGYVIANEAMDAARTREGDLELAVRRHARLVYRIVYSVLRNHQDAEDATQETFIRVLRARRKLATVNDPRSWLARIAWRVAVERRRKPAEVSLEELSDDPRRDRWSAEADEQLLGREMNRLLQDLIARLPPKLREPLVLSTVEEMSTLDIAATLGTSEAAVRSRLYRARQILRERFSAVLEGQDGT